MVTTAWNGGCELCGKEGGSVVLVDGKKCCPVCQHIRRNVKKRGELVLGQLREFHPALVERVVMGDNADSVEWLEKFKEMTSENGRLRIDTPIFHTPIDPGVAVCIYFVAVYLP